MASWKCSLSWEDLDLKFGLMAQVTDILVKLLWWFLGCSSVVGYLVRVSEALDCLDLAAVESHYEVCGACAAAGKCLSLTNNIQ